MVFTNQKCLEVLFFISYFSSFSVGRFCCDTEFYPNKQRLRKRKTLVMADFGRSNRRSLRSMHWLRRDLNSETDIREILGDYFDKNGLSCCYGVIGRINSCADFGSQNSTFSKDGRMHNFIMIMSERYISICILQLNTN